MNKIKSIVTLCLILAQVACSDDSPSIVDDQTLIKRFAINGISGKINHNEKTIIVEVSVGTDVTNLTPTIEISQDISISPKSGEVQDFSNPINYTITTTNESTIVYEASVEVITCADPENVIEFQSGGKKYEIVKEGKKFIPSFCRVFRIQRDIPTKHTIDGVGITNFRQYVHQLMEKENLKCKCIRCREPKNKEIAWQNVKLNRINYESSKGKEIFLSFEDTKNNILLSLLRLRIPYKPFRKEITKNSAIIREIHTYGNVTPLGETGNIQHRGLGTQLLEKAESIAKEEFNTKKMLIISGIGVKEYFKKFNYKKDGIYMSKILK